MARVSLGCRRIHGWGCDGLLMYDEFLINLWNAAKGPSLDCGLWHGPRCVPNLFTPPTITMLQLLWDGMLAAGAILSGVIGFLVAGVVLLRGVL